MEVIPAIVVQFVAKHIHSMDVLEILLLFRQEARKEWSALALSKALRLDRSSVEARLERLLSAALLTVRQVGSERVYRYHPASGEQANAVDELAKWYSSHRVALISLIFSNPTEQIRTYPDKHGTEESER